MLDVFQFMQNPSRDLDFVLTGQDEHNVNLNSCGEGDEYLDEDDNQGITVVSIQELMKREMEY